MFKNQSRARKIYSALGGTIGIVTILIIAIVVTILLIVYLRKKALERSNDDNDFLRYQKLIKPYLKIKRESQHIDEERIQIDMNRFEFSNTLLPVGSPTLNITWDNDSSTFGDLCNNLIGMVSHASDSSSSFYKNETLWKQIIFAIRTIAKKLPNRPQNFRVPWGSNWYQFSITYPTLLVAAAFSYYTVYGIEEPYLTRHLSTYISNYFSESSALDGLYSMGWLRYESNVIGMSVPLIGGRLYANRFDSNVNSQKYARKYLTAPYVYEQNGFYYDNTYITHVSRNDGYTTSFYYEFKFVYDFYRLKNNFFKILHKNFSITEHPDFPLHHGPWFNRGSSMKGFEPGRQFASYGLDIRGFGRGVCVRTKTISLHYCGQILPLAAYESDRTNQEWSQAWIFMRRPLIKTSANQLYKELIPYYDSIHSYGLTQVDWPSDTTTTTTFPPQSALCSLCYIQDKVAGMYNKYKIRIGNQYDFDIEEINLATMDSFHVFYRCSVDMNIAATKPYTIAVRLGQLDEQQLPTMFTGIGQKYAYGFDDFMSIYMYLEDIDQQNKQNCIKLQKILDPATSQDCDALYMQPTQRSTFNFGYSQNYYEYGSKQRPNKLSENPTINILSTDNYQVEKLDTEDAFLILSDFVSNIAVVTYAFNNILPRSISIKKSIFDERFKSYTVENGILNSTSTIYTVNTYEKQFQMVLRNVVFK